jgi:serine/threonine protein kinase
MREVRMRLGDDRYVADDEPDDGAEPEGTRMPRTSGVPLSSSGPRYEIGDRLGAGGMAEVFDGTMIGAEGFMRRVAIKRVRSALSQQPAFATMFTAEARIASRLSHPNVVSVLDFRRDLEERLFLVMELVEGKDLARLLDAGPIPPSLTIFIVIELLRGLGYVHDLPDPETGTRGVVHRDVSPQNLLLSYEGAVKVSDFGLAKALAAGATAWSTTVRGKPSYMAPEQMRGTLLDGRTDLYAVGVMLWEMLANQPLFAGTTGEIMGQVMYRDIAAPGRLRGGVPADLEAITMKLLARSREDRFPTAEAAIEALVQCEDMPRDGRGELVHVLAERFPRAQSLQSTRHGTPVHSTARTTHAAQITAAAPSSTIPSVDTACLAPAIGARAGTRRDPRPRVARRRRGARRRRSSRGGRDADRTGTASHRGDTGDTGDAGNRGARSLSTDGGM